MFVTNAKERAGLLVAVISGGRPQLKERPTHKFLNDLKKAGFANIVWVVSDHEAHTYQRDEHEICTYPAEWKHEYASTHWMSTDPVPPPTGFHGAFPGREWACLEAERRGCWGVLQLDDNIADIYLVRKRRAGREILEQNGGLACYADILAGIIKSTNARMVGAQLSAVPPQGIIIARKGFPYSLFIEQVGKGREHWYGPFEDDITHAYQYGTRYDGVTAAVAPLLTYTKESKSKTGMRSNYTGKRALQLQRIFPESARIRINKTKSNGQGDPRIFHKMSTNAIRNPLTVRDKATYGSLEQHVNDLLATWHELENKYIKHKIEGRINKIHSTT